MRGRRAYHRGISAAAEPAVAANFRDFGRYAPHAALGLTLELRMPATGNRCVARIGCNKLDLQRCSLRRKTIS
jgi:hypothetical protein